MHRRPLRLGRALFVIVATLALAACGGGGGGGGGASVPGPQAPQNYSTSTAFSTTSSTTIALPKIANGISGSITLPSGSAPSTANLTFGSSLPSGVPQAQSLNFRRSPQEIGGSNLTLLAAVALTVSSAVTVSSSPAFSFTLASGISGEAYIAYFDLNNAIAGWNVLLGPGTISGTTLTFPAQTITPPITFEPNDTYVFALIVSSTPANGASLNYSGTKTTNFAYGFAYGYPTTPPTPIPTSLAAAATVTVTVGSSPYPAASQTPGLVNLHVAESDAGTLSTSTYTTDSWIGVTSASAPYSVQLYASVQQEPSSDALPNVTTIYGSPQTTDQFPQNGGASWSNSPAANVSYSYADGSTGTRTVSAGGSYTDTENLGGGTQAVLTENADGSGSMTGPYFSGGIVNSVQFSANHTSGSCNPVNAGGSAVPAPCLTSTINYSSFAQTNYGFPATVTIPDATWYSLPLALYKESDTIAAGVPLPASCTPNSYGGITNDVRRTITSVDTLIGVIETTVLDSYEANGQSICLVTSDTQDYAYDEQGNTPYFLLVGSLGLETVTTNESLILQPGSALTQSSVHANPVVAAMQMHALQHLAHDRAVRTRAFIRALHSQKAMLLGATGGAR